MGKTDTELGANGTPEASHTVAAAKMPFLSLVLAMTLAVIVSLALIGGTMFWLAKSGRLAIADGVTKADKAIKVEAPKIRLVVLEPLLVNLADEGGHAYLRIAMTLRVEEAPAVEGVKPKEEPAKGKSVNENEAAMRDISLGVLGEETGEALLLPNGKSHLKEELSSALKLHLPRVKVVDVLFTEFLVQR